jgi:hypothetical protein
MSTNKITLGEIRSSLEKRFLKHWGYFSGVEDPNPSSLQPIAGMTP